MKKILTTLLMTGLLGNMIAYAQPGPTEKSCFPPINWMSKTPSDIITIQNGNGVPIFIVINVSNSGNSQAAGINVKNCGTTTNVKAGSSIVCNNNDANNPVTFVSDKTGIPAVGTYQIQQQ